ncbi:hypothetical protein OH76DRAFT_1483752 [Lentinus brumalis]|uniref:Uncharacterized protein n=1 Tax=Lentinus brumalis TaxID=2498619 RepID=A0A371D7Z7_9APHY|nr:hypothetical protein OH76DRAFT_1483752 [Polyporus brumalis]
MPCYPSLPAYAALRMDAVATVRSVLGANEESLEAARAIRPKTYLVYMDVTLPPPAKPWFCYSVMPVAPSLPPDDLAGSRAMCVPIAPNTIHSEARIPVKTQPSFPLPNCYHWDDTALTVGIRVRPEGWDLEEATTLPTQEQSRFTSYFSEDERRAHGQPTSSMLKLYRDVRVPPPATVQLPFPSPAQPNPFLVQMAPAQPIVPLHTTLRPTFRPDLCSRIRGSTKGPPSHPTAFPQNAASAHATPFVFQNTPSSSTSGPGYGETSTASTSVESLTESLRESLHIIQSTRGISDERDQAKDAELLPIVDRWYDLTTHLAQDEIPSPLDFYRERHEIVRIVRDARRRAAANPPHAPRPLATVPEPTLTHTPDAPTLVHTPEPDLRAKARPIRPMKTLRQLRQCMTRIQPLLAKPRSTAEEAALQMPTTHPRRLHPRENLCQMRERVVTVLDRALAAARPVCSHFGF